MISAIEQSSSGAKENLGEILGEYRASAKQK
jgi:hypothetical protein